MSNVLATKNVATILVATAMVFGFAFAFATPAKASSLTDLQAQVQALLAQISALQGSSTTTTGGSCATFTQSLTVGSKGGEVMALQKFLNSHGAQVAATGAGSPGNETSTFGPMTKAAVAKFQTAQGISPAAGYWGPMTRAKANGMCGGTTTGGTTVPTGPGISVMAGAQPANSLAPQGAARVPYTTFILSNNTGAVVTVNGITVQRTGLAQDSAFSGVVLVDSNSIQLGTSKTFSSDHQATVGDTFTINPGQSMTLTVAGNMAAALTNYAGQVAGISVVGVNTSVPVSGTLPISGAMQTLNASLAVGSVSTSTSAFDPGTVTTKNIGDTGIKFSGVKFTAGSTEDLKLYSIRWRQVGSVSSSDLANVVTIVNGTSYPTVVDSTGKYYTSVFPGGLLIGKGNSIDAYIQGDVIGSNASSRTADFDLDKVTDVYFVGQLYGYGIAPSGTYTPWYNGYVVTLSGASVTTIGKDSTAANAAQNIAINVANQPLGGFVIDLKGEPISVQSQVFKIATSSASTGLFTNVSLVNENGTVVAGPVDATWTAANLPSMTVTFTDTVTYPLGRHVYTLKGKVPSGATNGAVIAVSTTPSSNWTSITGQTTGNSVSITNGAFTMNSMTVKSGALAVSVSGTPVAQSIIAGAQGFTFATVQLDASQSGEDVRLNAVALTENGSVNGTAGAYNLLTTCQIYDGATALNGGSNVVNSTASATSTAKTATYTFDNSLIIAKGTVKNLAVKCNIASTALTGDHFQWGISSGQVTALSVTGVTSGGTIVATGSGANGSLMTVAANGTLTATAATTAVAQPALSIVAAGTSGVTQGSVKFHATNEDIQVTKIGLTLANGTYGTLSTGSGGSSSSGVGDVITARIFNGATEIGSVTFTGTTGTSTLSSPFTIPANGDVTITIKADLAAIGWSAAGGIGDTVKVDPLNAQGTALSSGTQVNISATAGMNGVQMFKSVPTLALGTGACAGTNCSGANAVLKVFTVSANGAGAISVEKFQITVATSTATVVTVNASVIDNYGNVASTTFGAQQCVAGNLCALNPTLTFSGGPVIIPAGTTYTFKITSTVTPDSGATNWSVISTVVGTSSATGGLGTTPGYIGTTTAVLAGSNFIWSDNATTTASLTDVDWFPGYQINGLPSIGL